MAAAIWWARRAELAQEIGAAERRAAAVRVSHQLLEVLAERLSLDVIHRDETGRLAGALVSRMSTTAGCADGFRDARLGQESHPNLFGQDRIDALTQHLERERRLSLEVPHEVDLGKGSPADAVHHPVPANGFWDCLARVRRNFDKWRVFAGHCHAG